MNAQSQDQERVESQENANNIENTEPRDQGNVKYFTDNPIETFQGWWSFRVAKLY